MVHPQGDREVILDGRGSTEFGGGLDYGAGPDGAMRRSGKRGNLVIPSGSVYVFPDSVVEHSVRPVTVSGICRSRVVTKPYICTCVHL
jgi:hypothetical protein